MNKQIKNQIIFALEDDNELMTAALDSDLDEKNKKMNRALIKKHDQIIEKVNKGKKLSMLDLQLIKDANEIDVNDEINLREHHKQAVKLDGWLGGRIKNGHTIHTRY